MYRGISRSQAAALLSTILAVTSLVLYGVIFQSRSTLLCKSEVLPLSVNFEKRVQTEPTEKFPYFLTSARQSDYFSDSSQIALFRTCYHRNSSQYDTLEITLTSDDESPLEIVLFSAVSSHSSADLSTHYIRKKTIIPHGKSSRYALPLSHFYTPISWYHNNQYSRESGSGMQKETLSAVGIVRSGLESDQSVRIDTLRLTREDSGEGLLLFAFLFWTIIAVTAYYMHRKEKLSAGEETPVQVQKEVEVEEFPGIDELMEFLHENYNRDTLTTSSVSDSTGIPTRHIRMLLQEEYGKTLKQYVTDLRMNEAKRLIVETNGKMYAISEAIGYSHTSTFNHVFKSSTGFSPVEYRKKYRKRRLQRHKSSTTAS